MSTDTDTTDEPTTRYLLSRGGDKEFVIEIPTRYKITFASVNPAAGMGGGRDSHCVRVYEMPGSKLRAVFDSVVSIRDLAIPLARKRREEVGEAKWTKDSAGNFSQSSEVKVEESFVGTPITIGGGEDSPF